MKTILRIFGLRTIDENQPSENNKVVSKWTNVDDYTGLRISSHTDHDIFCEIEGSFDGIKTDAVEKYRFGNRGFNGNSLKMFTSFPYYRITVIFNTTTNMRFISELYNKHDKSQKTITSVGKYDVHEFNTLDLSLYKDLILNTTGTLECKLTDSIGNYIVGVTNPVILKVERYEKGNVDDFVPQHGGVFTTLNSTPDQDKNLDSYSSFSKHPTLTIQGVGLYNEMPESNITSLTIPKDYYDSAPIIGNDFYTTSRLDVPIKLYGSKKNNYPVLTYTNLNLSKDETISTQSTAPLSFYTYLKPSLDENENPIVSYFSNTADNDNIKFCFKNGYLCYKINEGIYTQICSIEQHVFMSIAITFDDNSVIIVYLNGVNKQTISKNVSGYSVRPLNNNNNNNVAFSGELLNFYISESSLTEQVIVGLTKRDVNVLSYDIAKETINITGVNTIELTLKTNAKVEDNGTVTNTYSEYKETTESPLDILIQGLLY